MRKLSLFGVILSVFFMGFFFGTRTCNQLYGPKQDSVSASTKSVSTTEQLQRTAVSGLAFASETIAKGFPTPSAIRSTAWYEILGSFQEKGNVYIARDIGSGLLFAVDGSSLTAPDRTTLGLQAGDLVSAEDKGADITVEFFYKDSPRWLDAKGKIESGEARPNTERSRAIQR